MGNEPYRPTKPCAQKGCRELVPSTSKFCEKHRKDDIKAWAARGGFRESASERGYDHRWSKFRKRFLASKIREGVYSCNICNGYFRSTSEIQLDHIKPLRDHPELKFDPANLQLLCRICHIKKTSEENK